MPPLSHLGSSAAMGPLLQVEVESQLLADLRCYGVGAADLRIDWSSSCQEGHCTYALDGNLEELSSVVVLDSQASTVAEGWMDFIHSGQEHPLFVFWLFLSVFRDGGWVKVKHSPTIPRHVWARLPEETKILCSKSAGYDNRWSRDPTVVHWARGQ